MSFSEDNCINQKKCSATSPEGFSVRKLEYFLSQL
jgi:hypothetical protein